MGRQVFINKDVLTSAKERISKVFDEFENVSVSISGGKDSTVLAHLVLSEAHKRNRKVGVFFLDEEVDYEHTIEQIEYIMFEMFPNNVIPLWYQIPFHLTNATSLTEPQLICWEEGKDWMRPKDSRAIQTIPWDKDSATIRNKAKGFGFYDVIDNYQGTKKNTCFFVGLRASESYNRYLAVAKNPGYKDWLWTTKQKNNCVSAYPLYDWTTPDIWKYIYDNKVKYNKVYDWMWKQGVPLLEIRVSSLIHEKSFKSIMNLPAFEPDTYNKLLNRLKGISVANLYAKDNVLIRCKKLPKNFKSWIQYRNFLMDTYPDKGKLEIFKKRFSKQFENEYVARQQVKQLVLNDYENNLPIDNKTPVSKEKIKRKWMNLL